MKASTGKQKEKRKLKKEKAEEKIKKLKDKYISLNDTNTNNVNCAYVVFRSMEGKERVERAYNRLKGTRRCTLFCTSCCSNRKYRNLILQGKFLNVREARDPSLILWENLGSTKYEQSLRIFVASIVGIILLAITAVINLYAA